MNIPFLSTELPHGTLVFLTEKRRSSIRGQERAWGVATNRVWELTGTDGKEQMIWAAS
jgi:hypothetical protein